MIIRMLDQSMVEKYFNELYLLKCCSILANSKNKNEEATCRTCREKLLELPAYMEQGKAVVFGAFDSDKLTAFVWAYPRFFFNEKRLFINGLSVDERIEGSGIAKKLIESLIDYARAGGYNAIDLTVAPFNKKAVGFYKHLNFEDERIQMCLQLE